jgi:hypothetical protein
MNRREGRQDLQPADPANPGFEIVTDEDLKSVTGGIYLIPHYMIRRDIDGRVYYESYHHIQMAPLGTVDSPTMPPATPGQ